MTMFSRLRRSRMCLDGQSRRSRMCLDGESRRSRVCLDGQSSQEIRGRIRRETEL